jgi:hypothetical protein
MLIRRLSFTTSHSLLQRRPEQIPCEDCFRLAQAGWPIRHSAERSERLPRFLAHRSHTRCRQSHGVPAKGDWCDDSRAASDHRSVGARREIWPIWPSALRASARHQPQPSRLQPADEVDLGGRYARTRCVFVRNGQFKFFSSLSASGGGPLWPHTDGQLEEQMRLRSGSSTSAFRSFFGSFGPRGVTSICTALYKELSEAFLNHLVAPSNVSPIRRRWF